MPDSNAAPDANEPLKIGPGPIGFPVSAKKFWLMSVFTCFLYTRYWAYKQFANVSQGRKRKFNALLYALFLPVSFYSLMSGLEEQVAGEKGVLKIARKPAMAFSVFILFVVGRFMETLLLSMLVGALSAAILFKVQLQINKVNAELRPEIQPDYKFTVWDITGIGLVATFLAAAAIVPRMAGH